MSQTLKNVEAKVDTIYLVGGFGGSQCSILTLVITYFQLCTLSLYSIHTNVLLIRTLCVVMLCILTLCAIFNLSIFVYINAVFVLYRERDNICESEFNNTRIRTRSYHNTSNGFGATEL